MFPCGHEGEIIIGGGRGGGEKNINYILEFNATGTCPVWVGGVKDIAEKVLPNKKNETIFNEKGFSKYNKSNQETLQDVTKL